jgi:adenylylsulfate kinase
MSDLKNIFPVFDQLLQRRQKEAKLKQHSCVIWMTGLSGSGKTTIAIELEKKLFEMGYFTEVLDGDNVRSGINNNIGFSDKDRNENIRRIAEVAKLFLNAGVITICCFVSPTEQLRSIAKQIIGEEDFVEVFVKASIEACEKRDVKGLYKKARAGEVKDFTGISSPFEVPANPDITIDTTEGSIEECTQKILQAILPKIKI